MMNKSEKKNVLIIDDKKENIKILIELLRDQYTVFFAMDGTKGYELVRTKNPDIILLDIMMEPVDGYAVCRKIRKNIATADIPVIFMTGVSDSQAVKRGFEAGGDDFILKPFIPAIVLKRIGQHIDMAQTLNDFQNLQKMELDMNPLTLLPGPNSIQKHISLLIESQKDKTVFYLDVDRFRYYNKVYGYLNGNKVIVNLSGLLKTVADKMNIRDIFIGHHGGDDFFITLESDMAEAYIKNVIRRFDEEKESFYNENDLERKFVMIKNRKGEHMEIPLLMLSIAGINLRKTNYSSYLQLKDACRDIKQKAIQTVSSNCIMDKRVNLV